MVRIGLSDNLEQNMMLIGFYLKIIMFRTRYLETLKQVLPAFLILYTISLKNRQITSILIKLGLILTEIIQFLLICLLFT